ncbi:hypothetical protein M9H77_19189 [Catharanthus roseus]|uniref:Uncharacterized protein n=1 Tax=Catharanthus roseus TaxID=4058 RepID=A0ACC0B9L5_CATRO|nr:hypothetical protein M9H77_19189 [Catharanthus roseus]
MEKAEVIFIPGPGMGHLVPALEFGKLLTKQDKNLSILFLIINLPYNTGINPLTLSNLVQNHPQITFLNIPYITTSNQDSEKSKLRSVAAVKLIERSKSQVKDAIFGLITNFKNTRIAGIFVDIFCCGMIDLANEFELPSYLFFTCSAGFLGLLLYSQTLKDDFNQDISDISDYKDTDSEILVPGFTNPVPAKVLPIQMLDKNVFQEIVLPLPRKIPQTNGIILNTFLDLESNTIKSLAENYEKIPKIYPIGPIINHNGTFDDEIMGWLDKQPLGSVVFLCFGSLGSFNKDQVNEIALALERCGCRYLWSLRRPPAKGEISAPESYDNPDEILPKGFLERTSGVGKVIGWAPQAAILGHQAVGGFISHCGWNSILESLWFGVPIAAWPLSAEQQLNAFEMVKELGISVEIKMDYRHDENMESKVIVSAEEIEKGIKNLMMDETKNELRKKVKELKEKCQKAMMEDGSSYNFLSHLIDDVLENIQK